MQPSRCRWGVIRNRRCRAAALDALIYVDYYKNGILKRTPTIDGVDLPGAGAYTNTVDTYIDRLTPTTAYGYAETLAFFRHTNFAARPIRSRWR